MSRLDILGPKLYQKRALLEFSKLFDTEGKRILEVGGSNIPLEVIKKYTNCQQWVCVDYLEESVLTALNTNEQENENEYINHLRKYGVKDINFNVFDDEPYQIYKNSVLEIDKLAQNTFDFVFSVACFEHVGQLSVALEKIRSVLKSGGKIFSAFSPIWSSSKGHHFGPIYTTKSKYPNEFDSDFDDFFHLIREEKDILNLLEKHFSKQKAAMFYEGIYNRNYINRLFYDDYIKIFSSSKYLNFFVKPMLNRQASQNQLKMLSQKYPSRWGFEYDGMTVIMEK